MSLSLRARSRICNRHRAMQRDRIAKRGERAEHAVAADHRDLDVLSPRQPDDERDKAAMRQVCALERFIDFGQHLLVGQVDGLEMRADQLKIVFDKRLQKSIRWTRSGRQGCLSAVRGVQRRCRLCGFPLYVRYQTYGVYWKITASRGATAVTM